MKVCTKCNAEKPLTEYFVKDSKTGRLHAHCKECYKQHRKTYHVEHYAKYGEQYRARAKIRRQKIKNELRSALLVYLKDKSCETCGESDICVLEFDHLVPSEKSFDIAWALGNAYSWETVLKEILKCRILCANCHKRHTAIQQGWYKVINQ